MSNLFSSDSYAEKEEKPSKPVYSKRSTKKGKVILILKDKGEILVDVNGNGERVPYLEKEHGKIKAGDTIDIP